MYVDSPFKNASLVSPADKRQIERRHLIYYMRVWDADKDILLGHLADVSTDGMMIVGETQIEIDKEYSLKMLLPSVTGEKEPFEFKATSCWSSNDINQQFFDTGFQFTDISSDTVERIIRMINDYGMSS